MLLPLRQIRVQPGGSFIVYLPFQEDSADPTLLPTTTTTTVSNDSGRNSKRRVKMRIERRPQGPYDPATLQPAFRDFQPGYPVQRPGRARRMIMGIKRVLERPFSLALTRDNQAGQIFDSILCILNVAPSSRTIQTCHISSLFCTARNIRAHCSISPGTFELIVLHRQEHSEASDSGQYRHLLLETSSCKGTPVERSVAATWTVQSFVHAQHPLLAIQQGGSGS